MSEKIQEERVFIYGEFFFPRLDFQASGDRVFRKIKQLFKIYKNFYFEIKLNSFNKKKTVFCA